MSMSSMPQMPPVPETASAGGRIASAGRAQRRLRILVCDDCDPMRELLHTVLTREGHLVEFAEDGQSACARLSLRDPSPDLLLVDYNMPRLDGLQLLKRVQTIGYPGNIVLMTASPDSSLADRCMQAGAHAYLTKPFSMQVLLKIVGCMRGVGEEM